MVPQLGSGDEPRGARDQQAHRLSRMVRQRMVAFLEPLLVTLDGVLDKRLVATVLATVEAVLAHRHRDQGLLLSELGAYLLGPSAAPAGTKRLQRLLHSAKWSSDLIEAWLWQRAVHQVAEWETEGGDPLAIWDESVLEKHESQQLEGLCAVRSSHAKRLVRRKPGFYHPPTERPIFVSGWHWLGVLLVGPSGPPMLAAWRWWTTRGVHASDHATQTSRLLRQWALTWGKRVLHVFDRGFAGRPWLSQVWDYHLRFVVRWPQRYHLRDRFGQERPAWQMARGQRSWGQRQLWDTRRRCWRSVGVLAINLYHPDHYRPLRLIVARRGQGQTPWYLLTSEPVATLQDAFAIVQVYAKRWHIELAWRFAKSELGFASLRLQAWERCLKLLWLATLVYAFLLSLLTLAEAPLCALLLHWGAPSHDKRSRDVAAPLYRLRLALSRLWLTTHLTAYPIPVLNSG